MANVRNGNTIYIDETGTAIDSENVKVSHIVFNSSDSGSYIILTDGDGGSNKIKITNSSSSDSKHLRFENHNILFPNGIHVQSLSTDATATIITKRDT